ncbi:MAG: polysaccharide deacetylase family protein [Saprospiraceae bacterium]
MAGYRDLFIYRVSNISTALPTRWLINLTNQKLIHPFYHAVSDVPLPHMTHLYSVKNSDAFIKDIDWLLKHFSPIDYPEFKQIILGEKPITKPSFLLSFDDGLSQFHDVIAPILKEKGVPAICFLNSAFIDNKALFFRYKASLIIHTIQHSSEKHNTVKQILDTSEVNQSLLAIQYADRAVLDIIADAISLDFDAYLKENTPYLSSQQIKSLIQQGFYFGAHSIDHPEYRHLDLPEQINQTKESVAKIIANFGLDYRLFSFPFTDYSVSQQFFTHLQQQNITDLTFGCSGLKTDSAPNHFQRIPCEMANLSAKQIVNAELLYFLAKWPFGRNKLVRHAGD